jgi:hypothetical protein
MATKEIKVTGPTEISTIRYMLGSMPEASRKTLVSAQCAKYKITKEFVREFREHLTKEAFTKSPALYYDVISQFPDMFDFGMWSLYRDKSLEPLLHDEFVAKYCTPEKAVEICFLQTDPSNITPEVFDKHARALSTDVTRFVLNKSRLTTEAMIRKYADLLDEDIFWNRYINIDWSNALLEHVLTNKKLTARFLVNALSKTTDLGFMKRMLNKDLKYQGYTGTFDGELKGLLLNIPQAYYADVFSVLTKHSPNAITYSMLETLLSMNDSLEEDFLLQNVEHFKRHGLTGRLAAHARANDYKSLMVVLKLS